MDFELIIKEVTRLAASYGPKLLLAILTLIIGWMVVKAITGGLRRLLYNRKMDASLVTFLYTLISTLLKVLLILSILGMVGVEVTSFIAFLGAAGLAIGLALQGSLQNFAGGVMILVFKPYKVGDLISAQGYTGVVSEIQIFHTVLKTIENNTIIIPNSPLATGSLTNYSTEPNRRVDVVVPVGIGSNLTKIREVLNKLMSSHPKILKTPESAIVITEISVGVMKLAVCAWVNPNDYWEVFFFLQENVKREFEKNEIAFPTPTQNINVFQK